MAYEDLNGAEKQDLEHHVWRQAEALSDEFKGVFATATIHRYIQESFDHLKRARPMEFVPVFVHRFTRERLRALAQSEGQMTKDVPEILYVCVHNAGRSQIAALFTRQLGGERVNVRSAGSDPADELNPRVVEAMQELRLDMSDQVPKPLTDEAVKAADVVITMGCGDACPIYPGKRYLDWELDDPAEADAEGVRRIRDEIRGRVERLLIDMGVLAQA